MAAPINDKVRLVADHATIEALVNAYGDACRKDERAVGRNAIVEAHHKWREARDALIEAFMCDGPEFRRRQIESLLELSDRATQGLWLHTHGAVIANKDLIFVRPRSDTGWVWKLDPTKELADGRFVSALVNWFRRNGASLRTSA